MQETTKEYLHEPKYILGMTCLSCDTTVEEQPTYSCTHCGTPGLEITYDYSALRQGISRNDWLKPTNSMWRYANLLPCREFPKTGLFVGATPLINARRLANELGVDSLYIKDDSVNYPTLSYKDRVVATAINKALEFNFQAIGCVSTGNVANSVSALAAAVGLPAFVVIPEGTEEGKIIGSIVYGAQVIKVRGNYDDANRLSREVSQNHGIPFVNINLRSYYSEGAKTVIYEIAEQLGWRLPRHIVLPLAGATLVNKAVKAVGELRKLGLIDDNPVRLYGAQATGSAPIATAFQAGVDEITPVTPNTVARSLAIGNPGDGKAAVRGIRSTDGYISAVSDLEIIAGMKLLASREGIFAEAAGGATMALTKQLIDTGIIPKDEEIAIVVTGNGYKTPEPVMGHIRFVREIDNDVNELLRAIGM